MGKGPIELQKVPQPTAGTVQPGDKFPMHVHSVDGKQYKEVTNDEELSQAVADGWQRVDVDPSVNVKAEPGAVAKAAKAAPKSAPKKARKK